ncbi:Hypothetical predicted protein [Olea europaea subsp. europaea]|uniref:Uncharacterized protein n=1 Tax=Olea europaea subsp. europaea TaxID=158383 RepID=A0A8S0TEU1_OLEEU|nr:Hypothetical predicted protein [Olea europaea subsp. europaea]
MSVAIDAIKLEISSLKHDQQTEISSLKHDQQNKLNTIVHMQGEIRTDLIDIRLNMQFMTESITALISSSMEAILTKFREKSGLNIVRDYEPLDKVGDAEITVDSKGKGKMETVVDVEFPYSLQPPSFDLGICFTQPTPIDPTKSKKVETYVESVIYDVLKDTKSAEKVESPVFAPSSGLPVKRAPRPAKALQSLYVHEGKQIKHSSNVFLKQLTELQTENLRMSVAIDVMKSEISSLKHDQQIEISHLKHDRQNKLNTIVHMQGEIRTNLMDIRSNMHSKEEILTKFREKSGLNIVGDYETLDKVGDAEITVDSKGKGKMETVVDVEFSYSLQPPSFNLGVCFTQPTPIEPTKSKKMETYVESVVYDVLKDTKSAEKVVSPDNSVRYVNYCTLHVTASHSPYQINMQESPVSSPCSGLSVKRAPRQAKALQSLHVHEGKQIKHSSNVVIFQHYNQSANHADIANFQNWFQRGYKPHNKKKFNDRDDHICPPFLVGQFVVRNKTWWYELVSRDVSLSSSV